MSFSPCLASITVGRSPLGPPANDTPKNTPKPDSAVADKRMNAWSATGVRRSGLQRLCTKP